MRTGNFKGALLLTLVMASIIALAIPLIPPSPAHAALTPHAPIYINGNDNFTLTNGVTSGSGTENDPYIIENWDISAKNKAGIVIAGTTAHFIIRNSRVHDGGSKYFGIQFVGVENGKIFNVFSENNSLGIDLWGAYESSIESCTIKNSYIFGIQVTDSSKNSIANCVISNTYCYDGIFIQSSSNNVIENCTSENNKNGSGIFLWANSSNNIIRNCVAENNNYGIGGYSDNNLILSCIAENNNYSIHLSQSFNTKIKNSAFTNNEYGIYLENSDNNIIENCASKNSPGKGIELRFSDNNIVMNVRSENNSWGVSLWNSSNNAISDSIVKNNGTGIDLRNSSDNNIISNDNIVGNMSFGIILENTPNGDTIFSNIIENNNSHGMVLSYSWSNTISNNFIRNNGGAGIWLTQSSSTSTVVNNTIANNAECGIYNEPSGGISHGIYFYHNNIVNNPWQAYDIGPNRWDDGYPSGGNYWSDYVGADNYGGENQDIPGSDGIGDTPYYILGGANRDRYPLMSPWHAPISIVGNENFIPANGVTSGSGTENDPYIIENWGISAENATGIEIWDTTAHFIIRNCHVYGGRSKQNNGISFYSVENGRIDKNICFNDSCGIFLYYSFNNAISNNICGNNGHGAHLIESDNNTLSNNTCENNSFGIDLDSSSNNTLSLNNTCGNEYLGILLLYSHNNTLTNNSVENNLGGIYLGDADNNLISKNTVEKNEYGIRLYLNSNNNLIYHNNIVNNATQAYDDSVSYWDNGYPSGGNYWSDYTGEDNYRGDREDREPGSDGLGDVPYYISGDNNLDRYPLMNPFPPPWTGWAVFGFLYPVITIPEKNVALENLYAARLEKNLYIAQGSKLVVKFYKYDNTYESEVVIENFIPPVQIKENEIVLHPSGIGMKRARLDLTGDNTEEVISTMASFTVTKSMLAKRYLEIKREYIAPGADRPALAAEYLKIKSQYFQAP